MLKNRIKQLAKEYFKDTVAIRRHLHAHPELSYQEKKTGKYVAAQLKKVKIPFKHGMAGNGVVGLIKGNNPSSRVIALRADMDALPIQEANKVSYKSKNPGVMHACGHDVHTASLLGTARILNELKSEFEGTIKLIFQPAEEKMPGGASIMINEGVLKNPNPSGILGQHVHPPLEVGKIGIKSGLYMASADEIYVTITGKGGHGALPHECIDPILIAAQLLTSLQQLVSRKGNPTIPSVLTFGKINSTGGATNIIPNEVKLMGTFRTMDEKWRKKAHRLMIKMANSIAKSLGGSCDFKIVKGYPCLYNEPLLTEKTKQSMIEYMGKKNVVELPIRMTAEDFSYYSHEIPGCFYRLGTGNKQKGITSPVHTNTFNVDERSLEISTGLMAWLAMN